MATLFLSDLHLPAEPSPLREGFLRFLTGPARTAQAVYLLGDVFEYWIGDDCGLRSYAAEIEALRQLTAAGVAVHFMHGNRDFLVGRAFARATGVALLRDPTIISLDGRPALLSHGDRWCTDDRSYQRWRRFSRNPLTQWLFLKLPEARRQRVAGGVRDQSTAAKRHKADTIMDVNASAVTAALRRHAVDLIIHGHTHRPADHRLQLGGREAQRVVLADWHPDRMEYLAAEHGTLRRVQLPTAGA